MPLNSVFKKTAHGHFQSLPTGSKNESPDDCDQLDEGDDRRIGAILVDRNFLTLEQAADIVELQRYRQEKFGALAIQQGYCDEAAVNAALIVQSKPLLLKKEDRNRLAPHIRKILADSVLVSQFNQGMAHLELRWFTGAPERKCLSFVASTPNEGCSTAVAMFAILFAQMDRKVLIIDASSDVKSQSELFGITETELTFGQVIDDPARCLKLPQVIESLDIRVLVSTDNIDGTRHVQSRQFARLLDFASNHFDMVLVDTAPVKVRSDAFTIAMRCSGAVAIVRLQNSKSEDTRELIRGLTASGVEIVGSIGTHF
jgi:protein-tyrosine kinase